MAAIIRNKELLGKAMKKLAAYEDAEKQGIKICLNILSKKDKEGD